MNFYNKNKKAVYIGAAALVILIIGVVVLLVSCGGGDNDGKDKEKESGKKPSSFTITLQSEGGMVFPKVDVYIYEDGTLAEMVAAAKTDDNGKMTFASEGASEYVAVLKGVPEGYEVKEYYEITEADTVISLETVINPVDLDNSKLDTGNIMQELEVTTPDGDTVKVSELLKEKKAVMLNFFFLACQPCKGEFPFMQEAYAKAGEDIAVIALTPVDSDDEAIKKYAEELGLTFYVAKCDNRWEKVFDIKSYPTSVIVDRYGMISLIHPGSITNSETFEAIFNYYTADTYKQQVVRFVEDIINYKGEEGTEENPIAILPDATEFEANVKAEGKVYFEIPKVTNLELKIEDENAYVIYDETTYKAENGVVKVVISAPDTYTPAKFIIGNSGKEDKTFKATLSGVAGTMMNPHLLSIGAFTTNVEAGNEQGVYYTYTATESGTLTLKCVSSKDDVKYDITLYNLNTYENHTLSADANEDGSVSIIVNGNDVVQITVAALPNENNEYPAGEFGIEASFVPGEGTGDSGNEAIEYTVKVTDNNGKAMSGVKIVIDTIEANTDSKGIAKATLKAGAYSVAVTAPSGYKVQGIPTVTKDETSITVILVSASAKNVKYTIKVTDESGKALAGASVVVGNNVTSTDSKGVATVTLAEGTYDVAVSLNGYSVGNGSVSKNSTSITVKLKKSGTVSNAITYTVNVVDYKGNGLSGVTAVFKKNGNIVGTAISNGSGKVSVELEKGDYLVSISDNNYGSGNLSLSSSNTTGKLIASKKMNMSNGVEEYFGMTYPISEGAVYMDINASGDNYFIFKPEKSGVYEIKTTDKNAKLAFCGSSAFVSTPIYETNTYSTEVKSSMIGSDIAITVTGQSSVVIIVTRTGNVDETIYKEYTGKKNPTSFTLTSDGNNLTYVDVTLSSFNIELGSDGYYHKDSPTGPIVYVNLGKNAPYLSLYTMIMGSGHAGGAALVSYSKENGQDVRMDYTEFLVKHFECMDQTYGVYPLTEDLKYILLTAGEYNKWWDATNTNNAYLFKNVIGLNKSIAWMFACCY